MSLIRLLAVALVAMLPIVPAPALAHDVKAGDLTIGHPWSRPGFPGRPNAAYLTVTNGGETADRLLAVRSEAYPTIELHTVEHDGAVMTMKQVETIEIPAGQTVTLAPGGFHIMLFGGTEIRKPGTQWTMTLMFETAGEVEVEVAVEKGSPKMMDGMQHGHGHGQPD